ncbi:APC family permease [Peterkaempfera bronchialis]|uniref:APC family permease n=1 Tax=Peterkaempfera bronchialis TaxID=2126346 RepID=A0A345SRC3_9ACTN|nr:APC family permease [Peterkaempfera bronchialis]AXI76278.1 APC family permease [Peterkaempfera bronchialis]
MADTFRHQGGSGDARDAGTPDPSALLPGLDEEQLRVLRRVGRAWKRVSGDPGVWRRALPVDPDLGRFPSPEEIVPARFDRLVPISALGGQPPAGETTAGAEAPTSRPGAVGHRVRRVVLGAPLKSTAIAHERMRKLVALPVLSADALSSVAYGPEAMLAILVLGGTAGLGYSLPIAATIAFLMLAVGVSYRQTIRAYPHGGGSYIVAGDNLGRVPGLIAAAGLMTDYILTVAVSIASGVAAITSAAPSLAAATVPIGVIVVAALLAGNLRGIRQAGSLFAAPTYAFILAVFALVAVGLFDAAGHGFHPAAPPPLHATEGVGVLLVMRAFASGATAMTGIEAISNAVPAFEPVAWRNARTTLTWMVGLLIALFAGTVALVHLDGVVPGARETVLSQLAHRSFGAGPMYIFTQAATAAVLLLAANTAYNDFPRVLFLLARDDHAPRMFLRLGDRLAFSNGIILLSVAATVVYVAFSGETASLIPLYAVGVFLAFTLSQAGMVVHWWRLRDRHWRKSLFFNATGGLLSAVVFITAGITKFTSGAWVAVLAVGLFILVTMRIRHHYDTVGRALRLHPCAIELPMHTIPARGPALPTAPGNGAGKSAETEETPEEIHHLSVVPLASLDLAGMRALAYAASLQQPVLALHISPGEDEAERFRGYWSQWGDHLPLEVVVSPYRAIVAPLVNYIEALHRQRPDLTLTVILPEVVARHWWHRALHSRIAPRLRRTLRPLPKIVVTSVPFHV